jgi:brefeldin A-resistance guanine nucleotide exchange factor 1
MQCINPCREIRHHALSTLQRTLLSLDLALDDQKEWTAIFDEVLFPLVLRLLKPEVYHSDPIGMSETRVQAATLVCKIFLRYLDQLPTRDGLLQLCLKILDILDRMMNSGQGDSLEEAIPESLKNILLVMGDGGYLAPPTKDPSKEKIWTETRKRLDRFLPNLFTEIFPEPAYRQLQPAALPTSTSQKMEPSPSADSSDAPDNANGLQEMHNAPGHSEADPNAITTETEATANSTVVEPTPDDVD